MTWWDRPEPRPFRTAFGWLVIVVMWLIPGAPHREARLILAMRKAVKDAERRHS